MGFVFEVRVRCLAPCTGCARGFCFWGEGRGGLGVGLGLGGGLDGLGVEVEGLGMDGEGVA